MSNQIRIGKRSGQVSVVVPSGSGFYGNAAQHGIGSVSFSSQGIHIRFGGKKTHEGHKRINGKGAERLYRFSSHLVAGSELVSDFKLASCKLIRKGTESGTFYLWLDFPEGAEPKSTSANGARRATPAQASDQPVSEWSLLDSHLKAVNAIMDRVGDRASLVLVDDGRHIAADITSTRRLGQ